MKKVLRIIIAIVLLLINLSSLTQANYQITSSLYEKSYSIPSDYPLINSNTSLVLLDDNSIKIANERSKSINPKNYYIDQMGYEIGFHNHEADISTTQYVVYGAVHTKSNMGVTLITPFSMARYEFFSSSRQYLQPNRSRLDLYKNNNKVVFLVTYVASRERMTDTLKAQYPQRKITIDVPTVANVVIKKNNVAYPSIVGIKIDEQNTAWAFPIDVFTSSDKNMEIIVIDENNRHELFKFSGEKLKKFM